MLCKGWNLRVHREFSVSIRWNTMANAFGSSCAYHTRQTQCWAESSQLIRTGREQFLLQEESRATPNTRATLGFFFSFGMIINLWQIPQIHAAQSRLTRKKNSSVNGETFLKDLQGFLCFLNSAITFYSMQFALCSQGGNTQVWDLCVWTHVPVLRKGKCKTDQPWAGPAHFSREALGSNTSEISLISLTCPSVLLTSKKSPLTEMQIQVSWMFGHPVH